MAKKKAMQDDSIGDAMVLDQIEKILGCGPGEDVLVRAKNLQQELRIARADIETKDAAGQNLMMEMNEAREIVLNGKKDDKSTLTELLTDLVGAFRDEARDMRETLGLPGNADWEAISKEVARVRGLVNEYGDLKAQYDALVAEKEDLAGELRRAQDARDNALVEIEAGRALYSEQTVRLNSQIDTVARLENDAKSVRFILTGENQGEDSLLEIANQAMSTTAGLRGEIAAARDLLTADAVNPDLDLVEMAESVVSKILFLEDEMSKARAIMAAGPQDNRRLPEIARATVELVAGLENQLAVKDGFASTPEPSTFTNYPQSNDTEIFAAFGRAVLRGEVSLNFRQTMA